MELFSTEHQFFYNLIAEYYDNPILYRHGAIPISDLEDCIGTIGKKIKNDLKRKRSQLCFKCKYN